MKVTIVQYLISILHHVAGVGFGLYDLKLFSQCLRSQILLSNQTQHHISYLRYIISSMSCECVMHMYSNNVWVLHPIDAVPVSQVCVSGLIIVTGVRGLMSIGCSRGIDWDRSRNNCYYRTIHTQHMQWYETNSPSMSTGRGFIIEPDSQASIYNTICVWVRERERCLEVVLWR